MAVVACDKGDVKLVTLWCHMRLALLSSARCWSGVWAWAGRGAAVCCCDDAFDGRGPASCSRGPTGFSLELCGVFYLFVFG